MGCIAAVCAPSCATSAAVSDGQVRASLYMNRDVLILARHRLYCPGTGTCGPSQDADARPLRTPADAADAGLADLVAQQVAAAQLRRRRQVQTSDRSWAACCIMQAGEGTATSSDIGDRLRSCCSSRNCFLPRSCRAEGCGHVRPCRISASACCANTLYVGQPMQCRAEDSSAGCKRTKRPSDEHASAAWLTT